MAKGYDIPLIDIGAEAAANEPLESAGVVPTGD
jgi:hypothetical protein